MGPAFTPRMARRAYPITCGYYPFRLTAPSANPLEGLWDQLKDHLCNKVFASLRAMRKAITEFLRPFWENPARVRDLIGYGWLLAQAQAFFRRIYTYPTG